MRRENNANISKNLPKMPKKYIATEVDPLWLQRRGRAAGQFRTTKAAKNAFAAGRFSEDCQKLMET